VQQGFRDGKTSRKAIIKFNGLRQKRRAGNFFELPALIFHCLYNTCHGLTARLYMRTSSIRPDQNVPTAELLPQPMFRPPRELDRLFCVSSATSMSSSIRRDHHTIVIKDMLKQRQWKVEGLYSQTLVNFLKGFLRTLTYPQISLLWAVMKITQRSLTRKDQARTLPVWYRWSAWPAKFESVTGRPR